MMDEATEERFWRRVDIPHGGFGCWKWTGGTSHGHGVLRLNGRAHTAHHALYEHIHGPLLDGWHVFRTCHNGLCVSPVHLLAKPTKASVSLGDKFWGTVARSADPDGCWAWTGGERVRGYGSFQWARKIQLAHRVAWELTNGPISDGLCVCHRCDNHACVRPDHLFLGTHDDNMRDMAEKGRAYAAKGEAHPRAKFINADIVRIRNMVAQGMSQGQVGRMFGVAQGHISNIVRRKTWRHVW